MRYKVAPPARSLDFLADARRAVPLVPDSEADCCQAIQNATDLSSRETARDVLVFLHALGLVDRSDRGYFRTQTELDRTAVADAFRDRVFAVAELLAALEGGPVPHDEVFTAVRDAIPQWERNRHADWDSVWRRRVEHLLAWAVVFGLVETDGAKYRLAGQ